jgi:mannose-1-phosphate guanylyltransferase
MSRELFPKQYIAFQPGKGSLFQETLKRLEGLEDCGPPIVVCNQANRFLVA